MRARSALHFEQARVAKATRAMLDATAGEAQAETALESAERRLDNVRREATS